MPEIQNPIKLAFRLAEVPWREAVFVYDQGRELEAIPLREIFGDDVERTLWLAIKSRHITSQYFGHMIRDAAASIRKQPPSDARDLHSRIANMTGRHSYDDRSKTLERDPFCEELFSYVLAALGGGQRKLEYREPVGPQAGSPADSTERPLQEQRSPISDPDPGREQRFTTNDGGAK